ncbi:glycosyltransferase family 4 protein [Patescibacteria group bacterium]
MSKVGTGEKISVFASSHITEAFGPVQALKSYLIKKFSKFIFVEHPFTYSKISSSKLDTFRGSLLSAQEKRSVKGPLDMELISYVSNFALTIYWFLKVGRKTKIFIGIDALNAFAGAFLKFFGFKFKLVYYSVDFNPKRFKNPILNSFYHCIDKLALKNADYVWNSSKRIATVRRGQGVAEKKNLVVHNGTDINKIEGKVVNKDRNTLVIVEHLTSEKGVQLVIKSLRKIRKINKEAKVVVVGTGPFEDNLKAMAKRYKVSKHINFVGSMSPNKYREELGSFGIGLCLYEGNKNDSAYFSDPISPKEFFGAGLPVVVTDILWIAEDVEKEKLGKVISYNEEDLTKTLNELWNEKGLYKECSDNAKDYIKKFSWTSIFEKTFEKMEF